jgi:hypothetical protein
LLRPQLGADELELTLNALRPAALT